MMNATGLAAGDVWLGALTLVCLALFALSVGWWLVDWLSGGRDRRRTQRIHNGETQ